MRALTQNKTLAISLQTNQHISVHNEKENEDNEVLFL